MANISDLEWQESNNFIHTLHNNGETIGLRLLREQLAKSRSQGQAGEPVVRRLESGESDIGRQMRRYESLEKDIQEVMDRFGVTVEMVRDIVELLKQAPEGMENLDQNQREKLETYWALKRECLMALVEKGYSLKELYD